MIVDTLCLVAILQIDRLDTVWRGALTVLALCVYPLLAVALGVVPRSHLHPLARVARSLGRRRAVLVDVRSRLAALPASPDRSVTRRRVTHRRFGWPP